MDDMNPELANSQAAHVPAAILERARGRLSDRGIDPDHRLWHDGRGTEISVAGLYVQFGMFAASEKAGQSPTYALARLALRCGLPNEIADALYLAYNQQSAEEAGHGDKVFGNAYYAMGGRDVTNDQNVFGNVETTNALTPTDDPSENKKLLGIAAAALGGVETIALQQAFPNLVALCERWDHPIARDVAAQIRDVVRPEESRHVLLWRYVFHRLIVPKGERIIEAFWKVTNSGRNLLAAEEIDRDTFIRLVGTQVPTTRQLLGKDRIGLS